MATHFKNPKKEDNNYLLLHRIQQNQQQINDVLNFWFGQYTPDTSQKMLWMIAASSHEHQQKVDAYSGASADAESELANPAISTAAERPQPSLFEGKLKGYQLKVRNS